jgi:hypothetical protein
VDQIEECVTSSLDKTIAAIRLLDGEAFDPMPVLTSLVFDVIWSIIFGSK